MRRLGIDISDRDVRLDFVAVNAGSSAGVIDRVEDREQIGGLISIAELSKSEY